MPILGAILVVLVVAAAIGFIWLLLEGIHLYRITRDWVQLLRGGARSLHLVSIEPPRGFIRHREATVTLEVENKRGERKPVERQIPIPIPQAFLWRVAGRVPLPIGRVTDKRFFNRRLFGRRRKQEQVA
jgi:hypothetical protein